MKLFSCILVVFCCISFAFAQNAKEEIVRADILEGTLLVPESKTPIPVVLIIAGSGPTDRDGNNPISGKSDAYKLLAEGLAQNKIASLRYDKRGVGKSINKNFKEDSLTFDLYIQDALAWVEQLSKDKRFQKIIVLGHSEGSLLGMVTSVKSTKVSKYISLAGAGRRIDEIILEQLKQQRLREEVLSDIQAMFEVLKKGEKIQNTPEMYYFLFRPSVQPYMISWLKYNPQEEIKKLQEPVLIIQGTTDIQVAESEGNLLKNANPKAQYLLIERMNHVLKESSLERNENIGTYSKPELPLANQLVSEIVKFILAK